MSLTKITTNVIADNAITQNKISNTVTLGGPKIANVQYADASFTVLDDTAANTSGTARLIINGEGFNSGAIVIVGTTQATSTTRVSATQLRANVTAQVAGSYPIYVQNTDGGTAIRVGGVTFSNTPIWGTAATLSNQAANTSFNVSISATSDSSVTYSNTTALPAGTTLLSNGYFYGTVTIGAETTYTFDVKANDAENQDVSRTFSLTVTVAPQLQLWAWGLNGQGRLGLNQSGNYIAKSSPVQVGSDTTWNLISVGNYHVAGIKTDGTLWLWGKGSYGALGLNDTIYRSSPVQVGASTNWSKITLGDRHCVSIKTDGTLWLWGQSNYGTLGLNNSSVNKSSPTQVGTDTNWNIVKVTNNSVRAIKTDGTLWVWGANPHGELGLNDSGNGSNITNSKSSPIQVGSSTNWNKITSCSRNTLGIKTDGTLWAWGRNSSGELGLNQSGNYVGKSSPTQVGSSTNWDKIEGRESGSHFLATKTDGTLWAWGYNLQGALGDDSFTHRSSPVQIGSNTNWNIINSGSGSSAAIKTDGTLWTWGGNGSGQLGLNSTSDRVSPTQVGTSNNWNLVSIGNSTGMALKSA